MKSSKAIIPLGLLLGFFSVLSESRANADPSDFTFYYRQADPGASTSIGHQFSDLPPLDNENLYSQFIFRINSFQSALENEQTTSSKLLSDSVAESQPRIEDATLRIQDRLSRIDARVQSSFALDDQTEQDPLERAKAELGQVHSQESLHRWVQERFQTTQKANEISRHLLGTPKIGHQLGEANTTLLLNMIDHSSLLAETAIRESESATSSSTSNSLIQLIATYAEEKALGIKTYLIGLKRGLQRSFENQAQLIDTILLQPDRVARLTAAFTHLMGHPGEFIARTREAFLLYAVKMAIALHTIPASSKLQGEAAGELLGDILLGYAASLLGKPLNHGLRQIAADLAATEVSTAIGEQVISQTNKVPSLASELTAAQGQARGILDSAGRLGVTRGDLGTFFSTRLGIVWGKIQATGKTFTDYGYKLFKKDVSVRNPMPADGFFARVMPREHAEALKRGEGSLSRPFIDPATGKNVNEAFVTAYEDIAHLKGNVRSVPERLSLYTDKEGTVLREISEGDVIVKFKFNDEFYQGIRSPIETPWNPRNQGFLPGGRTAGDAREWLLNGSAVRDGLIDIESIVLESIL